MNVRISAVICTRDRPQLLRNAIQSLVDQTLNETLYEIRVIDNGSGEAPRHAAIAGFETVRNLRVVVEPVEGLSRARNTGWQSAAGEYVAYLDDDATAEPQWLEVLLQRLEGGQVDGIGGPVQLIWERDPADWLPRKYWRSLGYIDLGPSAKPLRFPDYPYGCNMGFRKAALEAVGGFPASLGRVGPRMLSNEEKAVFWMFEQKHLAVWYEPRAMVSHFVPASRMTPASMIRSWRGQATSDAILQAQVQKRRTGYLAYRLLKSIAGMLTIDAANAVIARPPIRRLEARLFHAYRRAYIHQLFRIICRSMNPMSVSPESDPPA
jgi:cellulose synthase/poly-beta-1,6-N-acetylglucosamine synthase-like glycosyltransferase